ncbi:MAG TPA: ComEC/Rec2 family competence protein, partial [Rhizomicrobium sp.]|nr:ComEC/Rec2 family competence protein [Rhizomicrobium sp.]
GTRRYLRGIAITSLVGSLATAPFAAYHFDRATHYAVLGNLLAMPVMGFVTMPAAATSVMLSPFGLDRIPLEIMGRSIEAILAVGRWVSQLPGAVSITAAWPLAAIVLISLGGLWIAIWRARWRWLGAAPMILGLALALTASQPDILIARDGKTVAVRGTDGVLRLLSKPSDKYSAEEWLKRDGGEPNFAAAIAGPGQGVRCDSEGCIAHARDGVLLASSLRPSALAQDCATATIVVSASPTRGLCAGPKLVIDRFDVARNGAYAIWLSANWRIETVRDARGERPWNPAPRQRAR